MSSGNSRACSVALLENPPGSRGSCRDEEVPCRKTPLPSLDMHPAGSTPETCHRSVSYRPMNYNDVDSTMSLHSGYRTQCYEPQKTIMSKCGNWASRGNQLVLELMRMISSFQSHLAGCHHVWLHPCRHAVGDSAVNVEWPTLSTSFICSHTAGMHIIRSW